MPNKYFCLGILVIVLVSGISLIGCSNGSNDPEQYEGTWNKSAYQMVINGNSYTLKESSKNVSKGTLSVMGDETAGTVGFEVTYVWNGSQWIVSHLLDSGIYTKSGNTLTISGLLTLTPANGTWTKE